jgi:hypothetical protein
MESGNCPECVPIALSGLWTAIIPRPDFGSQRGLNQSYSPQRELSNAVLHSRSACREQVDSRLLVIRSQTFSLTPGPSFAHNLSCRCPNDQCEAILDIYTLRPFQWHQEHPKARCFPPLCRALNIQESRRTPTPDFSKCWASPPHLAKVGVRQLSILWFNTLFCKTTIYIFAMFSKCNVWRCVLVEMSLVKKHLQVDLVMNFVFVCQSLYWD